MDYSGYNYQQQHSYGYDPSQIQMQPYDQSYAAAAAAYQQQYYAYDPHYAYFPNSNEPQFHFQSEHAPIHPPGVNPTASQPTPVGPSQYRGRGGRGGRPFRGAGRGRGHGRGHGVGSSRHIPSHSSGPAISNAPGAPVAAGATSVVVPSSSVSAKKPPVPPRKICCEICKVECNSLEILEQHKNGKKHQKNMRMHEESQRHSAIIGQPSGHLTDQPKKVEESEKNGCPADNMGVGVIIDNQKEEIELQNNNAGNISEVPAEVPDGKSMDNTAARGRGLKRKKKGGKGGKYMRTNDGSKPVEPAQPVSFRCELCDVKCESQAVYQSHVTGRKHLSKLRRAHGPQALSGVGQQQAMSGALSGLQAFYPPDINALSNAINAQVQQGDNDPQVLLAQLLMTVISQAQAQAQAQALVTGTMAAQIPAPTSMAGRSNEPQLLQTQVSEITAHVTMENPSAETKIDQLPVPLAVNVQPGSSVSTQIEGGGSETKEQV